MASNVFRFDEVWVVPDASPAEVWDVLAHGELLPQWWSDVYLEAEPLDEGAPRVGSRLRAKARGFLPNRLRFVIEVVELVPDEVVAVKTSGDFDGRWRATLSAQDGGTKVDLLWEVSVERPVLRLLSLVLRPAFAWNHRWTTPRGEAGLRAFISRRRTAATSGPGPGPDPLFSDRCTVDVSRPGPATGAPVGHRRARTHSQ